MSATAPLQPERGDLRDVILEAATRLFAEKGYAATSMREVAEASDCTKPALYYHFENKAALFLEIIRSRTDIIRSILATCFAEAGTVRERLRHAAEAYFDFVRRQPMVLMLLQRSELNTEVTQPEFDWVSAREVYWNQVIELLQEGVRNGEIGAHVDLDDAFHVLAGIVDVRCNLWIRQNQPIPEDCAERAIALLFGGIAP